MLQYKTTPGGFTGAATAARKQQAFDTSDHPTVTEQAGRAGSAEGRETSTPVEPQRKKEPKTPVPPMQRLVLLSTSAWIN